MNESLKELKEIEADLIANKAKIEKAQRQEDLLKQECRLKQEQERKQSEQKAFIARQNLKNLERDLSKLVRVYATKKRAHVKDETTDKWDAFLADLRGEKKPRKKRTPKTEE